METSIILVELPFGLLFELQVEGYYHCCAQAEQEARLTLVDTEGQPNAPQFGCSLDTGKIQYVLGAIVPGTYRYRYRYRGLPNGA